MNICIVTVYDSINSGSFWQAKALEEVLKKMGHQVFFLQRKKGRGVSSSITAQVKSVIKLLLRQGMASAFLQMRALHEFSVCQKSFLTISEQSEAFDHIDYVILGSDTIWNMDAEGFARNYRTFWGGAFGTKRVSSYAGSAANTSLETIKQYRDIPAMPRAWEKIGVRDAHTQQVLSHFAQKPVEIVCDPTLLLTKEMYAKFLKKKPEGKYLFIYAFRGFSQKGEEEIARFAKSRGLRIVIGTIAETGSAFIDERVSRAPISFLEHMYYADYVITDTFHGTVFSVNFGKPFVALARGKKKVADFLSRMNLTDRMADEENLGAALERGMDYARAREPLERLRNNSYAFLEEMLNERGACARRIKEGTDSDHQGK